MSMCNLPLHWPCASRKSFLGNQLNKGGYCGLEKGHKGLCWCRYCKKLYEKKK